MEEPSLQMAALQSDYLDLSKEVMELGLDFQNEEKFRRRFDDLLVKREEVKTAAERSGFSREMSGFVGVSGWDGSHKNGEP